MAQSAAHEQTPLETEIFWVTPIADALLKCEKWQTQLKIALVAQEYHP